MPVPVAFIAATAAPRSRPHRQAVDPNTSPLGHSTCTCSGMGASAPSGPPVSQRCSQRRGPRGSRRRGVRPGGRQRRLRAALHLQLQSAPVRGDLGDRHQRQPVRARERRELGGIGHPGRITLGDKLTQHLQDADRPGSPGPSASAPPAQAPRTPCGPASTGTT